MNPLSNTPLYLRIILPVLWYGFIFYLTELPFAGGNNTKDVFTEIIEQRGHQEDPSVLADTVNFVFRALAHFFMFGFLAVLLYFMIKPDFNFNLRLYLVICLVFTGILGGMDEIHQSFVPGRMPRLRDVLIDCAGAFTILFIVIFLNSKIYAWAKNRTA